MCSTMFIATWNPAVSQPQLQEWRDQQEVEKVQPLMCHAVVLTVVATCTFKAAPAVAAPATPPKAPAAAEPAGAHDSVAWHLQVTLVMS